MNNDTKHEFKGTPGPWHAVQYACFWDLHTEPYYGEKSLLNQDECPSAPLNAHLAASSPLLLSALIKIVEDAEAKGTANFCLDNAIRPGKLGDDVPGWYYPSWYAEAKSAIEAALNLKNVEK